MTDLQRIYDELLTPEAKIAWLEQQLSTTTQRLKVVEGALQHARQILIHSSNAEED